MGRAPCCDKNKVKRGPWSPEEDTTLKNYVLKHGTGGNWIALPHKVGLKRCGKSCRLRWLNYLRPDIKHGGFTEEEDNIIIAIYSNIGSRWSVIASQLPGRTDNDIKNYWNTKLKKRLLASAGATALSDFTIINSIPNVMMNCLSTSSPPPPPPQPPVLGIDVKPAIYGTSSDYTTTTSTYPDIVYGSIQESVAEIPFNELSNFQDFPFPRVMEKKENSPSNYYHVSTTASSASQEISCFLQNDSYTLYNDPIISYDASYSYWSDNNYGVVAEEFLTELEGSKSSSNILLNGFEYVFSGETGN